MFLKCYRRPRVFLTSGVFKLSRARPLRQANPILFKIAQSKTKSSTHVMAEPSVLRTRWVQIQEKKKKMLQSKNSCNCVQRYPTTESQSVKLLTDDDSENYHILTKVASTALIYYPNKTSCSVWRHDSLLNLIVLTRSWIFLTPPKHKVLLGGHWLIWV